MLSVAGLCLDLSGVLLLGRDLVRVQRVLRGDAEERLSRLNAIVEEIGGIDSWAETVSGDFREWQWEEGRTVMVPGTFDSARARESFEEATGTIAEVGKQVVTLAQMQLASIETDRDTAALSLRYSYLGLLLIATGFTLQLPAYF